MDTFGLFCTIVSFALMFVFNIISVKKFGLWSCFSAYGEKWDDWSKKNINATGSVNLWSHITIVSAMLLVPPVLVTSNGYNIQFLCFFMPLYLFLVGITPDYNYFRKKKILHVLGVILCVISMLVWHLLIVHNLIIFVPLTLIALIISVITKTLKESWLYYVEMILYSSAYITLMLF